VLTLWPGFLNSTSKKGGQGSGSLGREGEHLGGLNHVELRESSGNFNRRSRRPERQSRHPPRRQGAGPSGKREKGQVESEGAEVKGDFHGCPLERGKRTTFF